MTNYSIHKLQPANPRLTEQLRAYAEAMHSTKGKYNGKKYVMLRGYIIARMFNNDPL